MPVTGESNATGTLGRTSPREVFPPSKEKSPATRVLVVDDEALIRWSIVETLTCLGYSVVEAGDGHEALCALSASSKPVDVVLLDYRLPDSDNLTLLSTIRRIAPESPVIMMTAFGTPDVVRGALELGADRVMNKQFEMQEVAAAVGEVSRPASA
jgi:two-component system, response regulator, stage 0 sporulation protein F